MFRPLHHLHMRRFCVFDHGKESTEVRKSQIKGKESENSNQELKRSPKDTQTHGNCIEIFRQARPSFSLETPSLSCVHKHLLSSDWERRPCLSKYLNTVYVCLCVLRWSLQFLVRVFTFLSLNLWFSYFGTFLSMWSGWQIIYLCMHKTGHESDEKALVFNGL